MQQSERSRSMPIATPEPGEDDRVRFTIGGVKKWGDAGWVTGGALLLGALIALAFILQRPSSFPWGIAGGAVAGALLLAAPFIRNALVPRKVVVSGRGIELWRGGRRCEAILWKDVRGVALLRRDSSRYGKHLTLEIRSADGKMVLATGFGAWSAAEIEEIAGRIRSVSPHQRIMGM